MTYLKRMQILGIRRKMIMIIVVQHGTDILGRAIFLFIGGNYTEDKWPSVKHMAVLDLCTGLRFGLDDLQDPFESSIL